MLGQFHPDSENGSREKIIHPKGMPILRIGLMENRDSIEFRLSGHFSVFNDQGISILKDVASSVKWRLKIQQRLAAKYGYSILLGKFHDRQAAHDLEYRLIEKGIGTRIKIRGGKLFYNEKVVNDNTQFWVVVDELKSEEEASSFARERLSGFQYKIIKEKINEPHSLIELFDSEFEKLGEAENVIRIVPESPKVFTYIYDSAGENEAQNRPMKYRSFTGPLEFRSTNDGKIIMICEMPLEKYVESVVVLDMNPNFPIEAIKAQAIAVRSKTIAYLGIKHHEDTFHLCSGSHCQVFRGVIKASDNVTKAVHETMGMVLRNGKQVIDANYSYICGGYTEAYQNLNSRESTDNPYPPVFDGPNENQFGSLAVDKNLNNWVHEEPDVYCNLFNFPTNTVTNFINGKFRWHITYDRQELEEIIATKTGANIGDLYDIIPVRRGVSGRLVEVEILASNKNLVLNGEEKICQALAHGELLSSCFTVERQYDDNGFPISFSLYGAGTGHGVGLCQVGGIAMALQGFNYSDILSHYFKRVDLKKIY